MPEFAWSERGCRCRASSRSCCGSPTRTGRARPRRRWRASASASSGSWSAIASDSSRCSTVRGPTIGLVTPGRSRSHSSASWPDGHVALVGELADRVRRGDRRLGEPVAQAGHACRARSSGRLACGPVAAGEDAAGERRPRQQREPVPQRERDELVLDPPVEQVVRRLLAHVAHPAALVADGEALADVPRGMGRAADVRRPCRRARDRRTRAASLPGRCANDGRWSWYRSMRSVLQPPQRRFARLHDVAARRAAVVAIRTGRQPDLRREHDVVAPARPFEDLADDAFAVAARVHVGGVDEVDAGIERGQQQLLGGLVVGRSAEVHRPEAQRGHLHAGSPQGPSFDHAAKLSIGSRERPPP